MEILTAPCLSLVSLGKTVYMENLNFGSVNPPTYLDPEESISQHVGFNFSRENPFNIIDCVKPNLASKHPSE